MIVAVTGGRDRFITLEGALYFHNKLKELGATELINGGAHGIDSCVDFLSHLWGVKKVIFRAKWDELGPAAGPERNGRMADYADVGIAFRGGKGTANMIQQMSERGKRMISLVDARFTSDDFWSEDSIYRQEAIKQLKGLSL